MNFTEIFVGVTKNKLLTDQFTQEYLRESQKHRVARSKLSLWLVFCISLGYMVLSAGMASFGGVLTWVTLVITGAYFRWRIYDQVVSTIENAEAEALYENELKLSQSALLLSFLVGTGFWTVATFQDQYSVLGVSLASILYAIGSTLNLSVHFQSYLANLVLNLGQGLIYFLITPGGYGLFLFIALFAAVFLLVQIGKLNKDQFYEAFMLRWQLRAQYQQLELSEIELKKSLVREETANQTKSEFIAATSHDLRQSMHSLGIFVGALTQHNSDQSQNNLIQLIKSSANQLNNKFNNIIEHSRFDTGVIVPVYRSCQLSEVMKRSTEVFRPIAENNNLKFDVDYEDAEIYTDPGLVERVLANLIQNAINHTSQGEITVKAIKANGNIVFSVSDTGRGISKDILPTIFDPYVQEATDDETFENGSGLGLSIVQQITRLLKGEVTVKSEWNVGSTFTVQLPDSSPEALSDVQTTRHHEAPQGTVLSGNGENVKTTHRVGGHLSRELSVLVLDDDKKILQAMFELLNSQGARVTTSNSYAEARQRVDAEEFDLYLFDDMLNEHETGVDLAHQIKKKNRAARIIIITGNDDRARLNDISNYGFGLLKKPVLPDQLIEAIESMS